MLDPVAGLDTAMQIRLTDMTISGPSSKAGLMFREGTNSGSRHYSVLATAPRSRGGSGVVQVWSRDIADGNGAMLASVPLPADPPNVWLKLSHAGNTFSALVSTDGANWTVVNNHLDSVPYPTLLAGPAVTAFGNSASQPATATFEGWEFLCTPAIGTQPGPSTVITGILQNVTFSGLTLSDVCPVPVTYQWYKGATPLPGQTGSQLTLFSVNVADSGTYYAAVVSSAGVILSDPLSLTVTNALPVVLPETNHITTRVPLNISFAELLANDTDPEHAPLTVLAVNGRGTNVFQSDFNAGLPSGVILGATRSWMPTGGVAGTGAIKLTTTNNGVPWLDGRQQFPIRQPGLLLPGQPGPGLVPGLRAQWRRWLLRGLHPHHAHPHLARRRPGAGRPVRSLRHLRQPYQRGQYPARVPGLLGQHRSGPGDQPVVPDQHPGPLHPHAGQPRCGWQSLSDLRRHQRL